MGLLTAVYFGFLDWLLQVVGQSFLYGLSMSNSIFSLGGNKVGDVCFTGIQLYRFRCLIAPRVLRSYKTRYL